MKTHVQRFLTALVAGGFLAIFCAGVGALPACAAFGVQTPKTFKEGLLTAYQTHTAVLAAATNALNNHELSSTDAEALVKLADNARTLLDAARAANAAGDVATAQGRLALAASVLLQVQDYLRKQ